MEEIKVAYIYTPKYVPFISSSSKNTNTIVQTREFTNEERIIGTSITITMCMILAILTIYIIREFIKYSK